MRARDGVRVATLRLTLSALRAAAEGAPAPAQGGRGAPGAAARAQAARRGRAGVPRRRTRRAGRAGAGGARGDRGVSYPSRSARRSSKRIIDDAIAEIGATSLRDLGRVMADVMPQVCRAGRRLGREPARPREARLRLRHGSARGHTDVAPSATAARRRSIAACRRGVALGSGRAASRLRSVAGGSLGSERGGGGARRASTTAFSRPCATGSTARSSCAETG